MQLAIQQLTGSDFTPLSEFDVTVTNSKVATSGSSANRTLESFTVDFTKTIDRFKGSNTAISTVNTGKIETQITPINANITKTCGKVNSMTDLQNYTYNGNPNVYACKGDLIISSNLQMTGVKTILVDGNITFTNDNKYSTNDSNASWAFIAKGGNIIVNNNVTALEGTLVAIPENGKTDSGNIKGNANSNLILRIDGTVYGNAKNLFDSRTYARAGNAYDTLTTGTVITYSNRALRNPPPLLSQYLNAYQVQRVTR